MESGGDLMLLEGPELSSGHEKTFSTAVGTLQQPIISTKTNQYKV